ncbi:30S ribosomal protein S3 [bacterium]|nr:MAG: 30S ribosomal protein S3 [bacterium]
MGKKVHPTSIRLGINEEWLGHWFSKINKGGLREYKNNLREDLLIRSYLKNALKNAAVERVEIKRSPQQVNIVIHSARPGLIIGKSGRDIDKLKKEIGELVFSKKDIGNLVFSEKNINKPFSSKKSIKIDIEEVRKPDTHSQLVARSIAEQLEKRFPYRRVMKKTLEKIILDKELKGVKIRLAGRLNGAEIARCEWLSKGKIPLQTLSAKIDFAQEVAFTTYGTIGIKVWIHKEKSQNISF